MVDVTIYGAGIFGLSLAWVCARRGAQVRVIDPKEVAEGASGGIVGALAPHVPENWTPKKAFQLESLLAAKAFWAKVADVSGRDPGYARTGRLQPIPDKAALALARARVKTSRQLWPAGVIWKVIPAQGIAWAPLSRSGWLIRNTLTARIHPRQACKALAEAIRRRGGNISLNGTKQGRVVWCTGVAELKALSRSHTRMVGNGVKGQAALFRLNRATLPQLFADTVHVVPHADGTVAVGSTSKRKFADPDRTNDRLTTVIERAIRAVPALSQAPVIARWAGVRPRTRSRAPMLGMHPLYPGQFIANGGFKIGFGMAVGIAQVMADLVLKGQDRVPDAFRPDISY